ncbi:MAG: hypothetical protein VKJ44_05235 [Synechococcus sp.]|nr:hypothetical protein [Synechococcus sp.]
MHAHQIGRQLRAQVWRDREQGRPLDPRRLQAVIGDLCADAEADLVAPLRYLVLSGAFASAVGMDPPLADGRLLPRLQSELAEMYAAPLCARLQPVLEGLLDLPSSATDAAMPADPAAPFDPGLGRPPRSDRGAGGAVPFTPAAAVPASAQPLPRSPEALAPVWMSSAAPAPGGPQAAAGSPVADRSAQGGSRALPTLLAFLSGVLLMAVAGVGVLLWQRHNAVLPGSTPASPTPASPATPPVADAVPTPAPTPAPTPTPTEPLPPPATAAADTEAAAVDRAVGSIQELYAALSAKDFDRARGLYSEAAADQFDPGFFRQFERVSVQELESTGQVGSSLNLQGVVTFVWPDGSLQTETRTFQVDTGSDPPRISASEFGQVIRPR